MQNNLLLIFSIPTYVDRPEATTAAMKLLAVDDGDGVAQTGEVAKADLTPDEFQALCEAKNRFDKNPSVPLGRVADSIQQVISTWHEKAAGMGPGTNYKACAEIAVEQLTATLSVAVGSLSPHNDTRKVIEAALSDSRRVSEGSHVDNLSQKLSILVTTARAAASQLVDQDAAYRAVAKG